MSRQKTREVGPKHMVEQTEDRAGFVAGLREIAAWLEAHPEVPLPYLDSAVAGSTFEPTLYWYLIHEQRETLATIARAMGTFEKVGNDDRFKVFRRFGSIVMCASADRDEVCERIVVGTTKVDVEVLDPVALAAVPKVTVVKVVEEVEWRCHPVLADELAVAR